MILSNILSLQKKQTGNLKPTKTYVENLSILLKILNQLKSDKSISKVLKNKITNNLYSKFILTKSKNSFNFTK